MNNIYKILLAILLVSCARPVVQRSAADNELPAAVEQTEVAVPEEDWLIIGGFKVDNFQTSHPTKHEYFLKKEKEEIRSIELFINPNNVNRTHSLEGIEDLVNLKYLYIYGWNLALLDYSPLKNLKNLKSIFFDCTNVNELNKMTRVPDFSGMEAQDTVTEIEFRQCALASFENIETLPNLRLFKANYVSVPSLAPLNRLRYLKELNLDSATFDRSTVFRLEEIGALKNLEKIKIWTATVDIKGIEQLSSLKEIDFRYHCDLINTRNTSIPKSVESILIENRDEYPDVEFIGTAAGLKELLIRADDSIAIDFVQPPYQILDVSPLKALSNLESLGIIGFIVKNISTLDGLEQMPVIGLEFSQLYDPAEKSKHELIFERPDR